MEHNFAEQSDFNSGDEKDENYGAPFGFFENIYILCRVCENICFSVVCERKLYFYHSIVNI